MQYENTAVKVDGLTKVYRLYDKPSDRLKQLLWPGRGRWRREWGRQFVALNGVSFSLQRGEVLGVVGKNGAGKSTLLQLICGTLNPTEGSVDVHGRVAALLELGAGFNPEFTGKENIFINGAVLGLSQTELSRRYDEIVDFSGLREFIDQPVKTYSSGMYMRLAFSIATSVEPDVLVVDEALSVGDGEFARKSFDRIMTLRDQGCTILFCSHSLYQIEALCNSAIWLNNGRIEKMGLPADVVSAYQSFLDHQDSGSRESAKATDQTPHASTPTGHARLISLQANGVQRIGHTIALHSLSDDLLIEAEFASDPSLPTPSIAFCIDSMDGRLICSMGSLNDGVALQRGPDGYGGASILLPKIPLLKGSYFLSVYLFCEKGVHIYTAAERAFVLEIRQTGLEQGFFHIPHQWLAETKKNFARPEIPTSKSRSTYPDPIFWLEEQGARLPVGAELNLPPEHENWNDTDAFAKRSGFEYSNGNYIQVHEPPWDLCWIGQENEDEWLELFSTCFGHEMRPERLHNKYNRKTCWGLGARKNGKLIAFYGGMPRTAFWKTQKIHAIQIGDVMVHPNERGLWSRKGVFQRLAATYLEQQIGYNKPYLLGFGFPSIKAFTLAEKLGLYAPVDEMVEIEWTADITAGSYLFKTRYLTADDRDILERLFKDMLRSTPDSLICERNWDWLNHRYLSRHDTAYVLLMVTQRFTGNPLGAVVLRDRQQDGVELMDLIGDCKSFEALIQAARKHTKRLARDRLTTWITASHAHRINRRAINTKKLDVVVPINIWSPGPEPEELRNRWWLMSGDTDFR